MLIAREVRCVRCVISANYGYQFIALARNNRNIAQLRIADRFCFLIDLGLPSTSASSSLLMKQKAAEVLWYSC